MRKKEWGKGKTPQKLKTKLIGKKQCIISRSQGSEIIREGLGTPVFQRTAGPLRTQSLGRSWGP